MQEPIRIPGPLRLPAAAIAAAVALAACNGGDGRVSPQAVEPLATPAGPGSQASNLFAAESGAIYLSWIEPTPAGTHALRFSVWQDSAWSSSRTIAEGEDWFVNWADFPSLIALPDGRLAAHWLERSGSGTYAYGVRIALSGDGGSTWTEPVVPHDDESQTEHGFVSLFPWTEGRLAAVWLDGRNMTGGHGAAAAGATEEGGPAMTLRFAVLEGVNGAVEVGPNVLLDGRTCDCCQTDAALTAAGPIVVYRDRAIGEVRDIDYRRYVDGEWSASQTVHPDGWVIPACPVNGPAVAADGEQAVVAWYTAARDTPRVHVAFSADTARTFGPPVRIDDGSPVGRVDVAYVPGGAFVVWLEEVEDGAEIRGRLVRPGDSLEGEAVTLAASSAARASGFPRIAVTDERLFLTWTDPGEPSRVQVASLALPLTNR
ncbi:MAG: sialidase family protein [Longimicrobiales bacterium]